MQKKEIFEENTLSPMNTIVSLSEHPNFTSTIISSSRSGGSSTINDEPHVEMYHKFLAFALTTLAAAEPPSGYSYSHGGGGGGGGGFGIGGGGGGYQAVSGGFQTSEGQNVDPQLLEQVRQILLNEESKQSSIGISAPSSSYGVPSSHYGAPSYNGGRVVGIDLDGIRQAIQVAQFRQITSGTISGGSGYNYPSSSYGAPKIPSGSYGAP